MTDSTQPVASPDRAEEQNKASDWPKPGEEGYVSPDGTPQSVAQLAANRQAAADRAAVGSTVHGAPLGTPGPDPAREAEKAAVAAADYAEANDGHKKPGAAAAAERVGDDSHVVPPAPEDTERAGAPQETAAESKPKTTRSK